MRTPDSQQGSEGIPQYNDFSEKSSMAVILPLAITVAALTNACVEGENTGSQEDVMGEVASRDTEVKETEIVKPAVFVCENHANVIGEVNELATVTMSVVKDGQILEESVDAVVGSYDLTLPFSEDRLGCEFVVTIQTSTDQKTFKAPINDNSSLPDVPEGIFGE